MSKAKSVVYSEEKAKEALAKKEYIKIGDKRGVLKLTGAARMWKNDPSFTYVSSLRVAGRPADIVEQLSALGWSAADLKEAVKSGFTAKSLEDPDYLAELESVKGPKKTPRKSSPVVLPHDISYYAEALEKAVAGAKTVTSPKKKAAKKGETKKATTKSPKKGETKKATTKSPKKGEAKKATTKSPKKGAKETGTKSPKKGATKSPKAAKEIPVPKGKTSLKDKLAKLKEGKVMDVSAFTLKEQDAKSIDMPGPRSEKYVVGQLASSKKNGIKAAAKVLGDDLLVAQWEAVKAEAQLNIVKAKLSPKPEKSPKKKASPKAKKSSPAAALPLSPRNSPGSSPRSGGLNLPSMPVARVPTIGSPSRSPRL